MSPDPCPICHHEYERHAVSGAGIRCADCTTDPFCFAAKMNMPKSMNREEAKRAVNDAVRKSGAVHPSGVTQPPVQDSKELQLAQAERRRLLEYWMGSRQSQALATSTTYAALADGPCDICHDANAAQVQSVEGAANLCISCSLHADQFERREAARMRTMRSKATA